VRPACTLRATPGARGRRLRPAGGGGVGAPREREALGARAERFARGEEGRQAANRGSGGLGKGGRAAALGGQAMLQRGRRRLRRAAQQRRRRRLRPQRVAKRRPHRARARGAVRGSRRAEVALQRGARLLPFSPAGASAACRRGQAQGRGGRGSRARLGRDQVRFRGM